MNRDVVNGGCFNWRPERKSSLGSFAPDTLPEQNLLQLPTAPSIPAWNAWSDGDDVILVSYDIRCKWVSILEDERSPQTGQVLSSSPWEPG